MFNYKSKLVDSSRWLADILVEDIGNSQAKYDEMLSLALEDKYPVSMRAARILDLCNFNNKNLFKPHIQTIAKLLQTIEVEGVRRSFLKILSELTDYMDEDTLGILTDMAFNWMSNPKQAVAVRVYSIDLLTQVIRKYPELRIEFISTIESIMEEASSGLKSKCKNTLKLIKANN